jgi:DNA-binding transcriptional ArsR family regulator|tara:strand:+ start:713 stop:1054 length:342 start_codon:yes stop_codon:yes gene_type:complete
MRCLGPTLSAKELQNLEEQYSFNPEIEERAEFYNLISNPIRLKIIHLLREKEAVCVCDLKDIFSVTAAAVSQHLAKLKAHRIAKSVKQGQTVFYSLTDHPFLSLIPLQKLSQK